MPRRVTTVGRQRGFALLIVLWTLVLIAFLTAHLTAAGRTELRIAGNLAANAAAQAAADGAIYQVIFNLAAPQPEQRYPLNGAPQRTRVGASEVTLRLDNEAARINPNLASPALVAALLRVLGSDSDHAAALAAAIAQWVGKPLGRALEIAPADLPVIGLDYQPPRAPAESIDELSRVRGMTPEVLAALRPHLTLFGPGDPDPAAADPAVAAALALTAPIVAASGAAPSQALTVRIRAAAQGPGNAAAARVAVARLDPTLPNGYVLLAWDGDDR